MNDKQVASEDNDDQTHNSTLAKQTHTGIHTQLSWHACGSHTGPQVQTSEVLSVTCHALNPTYVQTHTAAHLSSCFHLWGLLSNSTRPQTVYRTCNIVHHRGNVRQMTQSLMETHKQNGEGEMVACAAHVCKQLRPSGDERRWRELKENRPSCVLAVGAISNMPWNRFGLRVKEMKLCFQLFLLSAVVWAPQETLGLTYDWNVGASVDNLTQESPSSKTLITWILLVKSVKL